MANVVKLDRRTRAARAAQTGLSAPPGQGAARRLPQVGRCKVCHARDRVWGERDQAVLPEGCSVGDPLPNREALRVEVDALYAEGLGPSQIHREIEPLVESWPERFRPAVDSVEVHTKRHTLEVTRDAHAMVRQRMAGAGEADGDPTRHVDPVLDTTRLLALEARRRVALGAVQVRTAQDAIRATVAFREAVDIARATTQAPAAVLERDFDLFSDLARAMLGREGYQELKERFFKARTLPGASRP